MSRDELTILFGYGMIALLILLLWIAAAYTTANIYERKGRPRGIGFLAGFLLGPIGILLALITPQDRSAIVERNLREGQLRRCPHCDELVRPAAKACPHCQRDIAPAP